MATMLYVGTCGADDPTRASLPFVAAIGTAKSGHQAQIALAGAAVALIKDNIAAHVEGADRPPLSELLQTARTLGVPIYLCAGCSTIHGVADTDVQGKNASLITAEDFAELTAAADWVLPVCPTDSLSGIHSEVCHN
jgi:predicted peroxiredoxin